jgi:hypothetical protein
LPTNDIHLLLHAVGTRTGALRPGGVIDEEAAARTMIKAFRDGRLGLWALDDMGLLFRGNANMAMLPGPGDHVSALPLPAETQLAMSSKQRVLLGPPEVEESLALISSPSNVPSIITPNSATSTQISTFVSSFFEAQRRTLTELSTSKNQVKKRELIIKNDARKMKWKVKFPNLVKTTSMLARGVGKAKGASRPFYIGGDVLRRKVEKARIIARKVTKKRNKRKSMSK